MQLYKGYKINFNGTAWTITAGRLTLKNTYPTAAAAKRHIKANTK